MNKPLTLLPALLAGLFAMPGVLGQATIPPGPPQVFPSPSQSSFQERLNSIAKKAGEAAESAPKLTKFDLDFPGGTPESFVRAIEKASGKPVNAIIPSEFADLKIPSLRMRTVTVPELFEALTLASQSNYNYYTELGGPGFGGGPARRVLQTATTSYGFRTSGTPREDSVWYFYYTKPVLPEEPKTCRFWQLGPYLDTYKIDDITTAIQTAYRMLNEPYPPVSFHKDTKLLIAVGEASKLSLIDDALKQLQPPPHVWGQPIIDEMTKKSSAGANQRPPNAKKPSTDPVPKAESTPTPAAEGSRAP